MTLYDCIPFSGNRLDTLIGALMSRTKNPESQESPEDGATQGEEGERKGENLEGAKGPSRRRAESESQGSSVGKVGYSHLIQESN